MTTVGWAESDDGAKIAAYDFGGEGPPLLFAHATGFHAHTWLPVIGHLTTTFHCYAFDERGHGATPAPANRDFDWRRFGDDARAVAGLFGINRPFVAGHSAGGALLLLAEEDHPGSWAGAWTFEPVILEAMRPEGMPDDGPNPLSAGALKRRSHFASYEEAYDNFASKPPFGHFDPAALRAYVDHGFQDDPAGGVTLACRPEDEAATYDGASASRAWERLHEVDIPVRVVCGGISTHLPPQLTHGVIDRLPRGTLEVLDGLGHFGPLEDPAQIAASIRTTFA